MSWANVEVVRRMYAAQQSGDAESALAHFDPDVVLDASRGRPDVGIVRGAEAVVPLGVRDVDAEAGRPGEVRPESGGLDLGGSSRIRGIGQRDFLSMRVTAATGPTANGSI